MPDGLTSRYVLVDRRDRESRYSQPMQWGDKTVISFQRCCFIVHRKAITLLYYC